MSTNFYLVNVDPTYAHSEHIGKRSMGWVFNFQGTNHKTYRAWVARLTAKGAMECIEDEYGREIELDDFFKQVAMTKECIDNFDGDEMPKLTEPSENNWIDEGYSFSGYEFC